MNNSILNIKFRRKKADYWFKQLAVIEGLFLGLTFFWSPGWKNKSVPVKGTCKPQFQILKDEYQKLFDNGLDSKSQLCVYVGEECVVDLYGDHVGDYSPDALQTVFSSGKSIAAILMGMLQSKGLFEWDDKVVKYWPEYRQHGKDDQTIAQVMRHEAGIANFHKEDVDLAKCDTKGIKEGYLSDYFAKTKPYWKTQKKNENPTGEKERMYHGITRDAISNEIFRRVEPKKRTMAEFLREELPEIDAHSGIFDETLKRVHHLHANPAEGRHFYNPSWDRVIGYDILDQVRFLKTAIGKQPGDVKRDEDQAIKLFVVKPSWKNRPHKRTGHILEFAFQEEFKKCEMMSANVSASARGLAKLAAYMANKGTFQGKSIMTEKAWNNFHGDTVCLKDVTFALKSVFTNGGVSKFTCNDPGINKSDLEDAFFKLSEPSEGFYGWMGYGGSVFQWHPELKIGFSYVPNTLMPNDLMNSRGFRLRGIAKQCANAAK